ASMASCEMEAPSALSFTTTTSPGITRIKKNTAMATPIRVGITRNSRRKRYQNMRKSPAGRRRASIAPPPPALLVEPDGREVLPEIVAGRHVPTLDLLVVDDNALPPQQRHVVGLHQGVAVHLAHDLDALGGIDGAALLLIELVELHIGVAGVAAG